MKPKHIYILIAVLLAATAPWPFVAASPNNVLGFPPWAFYCLAMTGLFAVAVLLMLRFGWNVCAGQDEQFDE